MASLRQSPFLLLHGGEIARDILAAVNVIFCFGHAFPKPPVLAVRPRIHEWQTWVSNPLSAAL